MDIWCNKSWSNVVRELNSNIYNGLKASQVQEIQKKFSKNVIEIPTSKSFSKIIIKQLMQLWTIILLLSAVMCFYTNNIYIGFIVIVLVSTGIIMISKDYYRKEKNLKELNKLNISYVRVIRDRVIQEIPCSELVVGDIVLIYRNQVIPADIRILESEGLKVNESAVTEDNFTVEKYETKIEETELALGEMKNILFKASTVIDGEGKGIVVATGMDTQISYILKTAFAEKNEKYGLNDRVNRYFNKIAVILIILAIINLVFNIVIYKDINIALISSIAIFMSVLPLGVMVITSILLFYIFSNNNKEKYIIKEPSVIETLSQVSAICMDKLDAFSEHYMILKKIYTCGTLINAENEIPDKDDETELAFCLNRLFDIGIVCNDSKIVNSKIVNNKEDLIEIAFIQFGLENNISKRILDKKYPRVFNIPQDAEKRLMTTVNKVEDGYRAYVKGAVDVLLSKCTHIMNNNIEREITEEDIALIKSEDNKMSNDCLNVIGLAYRNFSYEPSIKENIESNLVFVGLAGFENPLKAQALNSVTECKKLGIRPIVITEDNKVTAAAVGRKLNLINSVNQVLSGIEIDNMKDEEIKRSVYKKNMFSRIGYKHKVYIIKTLKEKGYITVIKGDKLADLSCINAAHVGIGAGSSNTIKNFSDIILKNCDFKGILELIKISKRIASTIKNVLYYNLMIIMVQVMLTIFMTFYYTAFDLSSILFTNIVTAILSTLAIISQYNAENSQSFGEIDKEHKNIKLELSVIGILICAVSAVGFSYGLVKSVNHARFYMFSVLNILVTLITYCFFNEKVFRSLLWDGITILNLILGFLFVFIQQKNYKVIMDAAYYRSVSILTLVGLLFITLYKIFTRKTEI